VRKFLWTAIPLAALALGWYSFAPQIAASAMLRAARVQLKDPLLGLTPRPLTDTTINSSPGTRIDRFGYSFEVPWTDLEKIDDFRSVARIRFQSGRVITFLNPVDSVGVAQMFRNPKLSTTDRVNFQRMYGIDILGSNYAALDAILRMTPDRVSLFAPRRYAIGNAMLLMMKSAQMSGAETGLFEINRGEVRGFQKGDPAKNKKMNLLELFDPSDVEIELWVGTASPAAAPIAQADLNRIVGTLHRVAGSN
jgi:hypothetical protein